MKKVTKMVLMLCLNLSGALCYAHDTAGTREKKGEDGTPIIITERSSYSNSEKGNSMIATLDSHYLTIAFTENLGQVSVEVATAAGTSIEYTSTPTPNGLQVYIPNTGDYIVTFTLPNEDEYYGEFTVTD